MPNPMPPGLQVGQHGLQDLLQPVLRAVAQLPQSLAIGVVVVVLHLDARVDQVVDRNLDADPLARRLDLISQLHDAVHLVELVEDPVLARLRRVLNGDGHTLGRVGEGDVGSSLVAIAV